MTESMTDHHWMQEAIQCARQAEVEGEVPVGAVLVMAGKLIARGWNCPITTHDPTAHAEILALRAAGLALGNYRMPESTLYVTLEPCAMCMTALVNARVARVVFGAADAQRGAAISALQLGEAAFLNHRIALTPFILEDECRRLLTDFFRARRQAGKSVESTTHGSLRIAPLASAPGQDSD